MDATEAFLYTGTMSRIRKEKREARVRALKGFVLKTVSLAKDTATASLLLGSFWILYVGMWAVFGN